MSDKKKVNEAQQVNPRVKSIKLSGARLAVRLATQARSSDSLVELNRLAVAQSTVAVAMTIVDSDFQRANRLIDMARSLANGSAKEEQDDRPKQ